MYPPSLPPSLPPSRGEDVSSLCGSTAGVAGLTTRGYTGPAAPLIKQSRASPPSHLVDAISRSTRDNDNVNVNVVPGDNARTEDHSIAASRDPS